MTTAIAYENEITQIVSDVFESMLNASVPAASVPFVELPEVEASVSFEGAWNGSLVIQCSVAQARNWTVRLMGIPADGGFDSDVRDAMGEIANMLGGNLKAILPPKNSLSVPSVSLVSESALHAADRYSVNSRVILEGSLGAFSVTLLEKTSQ